MRTVVDVERKRGNSMTEKKMGPPPLLAEGAERTRGRDAMRMNILAARAVAETVRTTLGPMGMDKMLVDSLGDVLVTNDGATIMREMDVQHPVARMMIEVARAQEASVGDGTTTVVVLTGELLKEADGLIDLGIHPVVIARGYRMALETCLKILDEIAITTAGDLPTLKAVATTTMTGKGVEKAKSHLTDIVVNAVESVAFVRDGRRQVDVNFIKIEKKEGGAIENSELIRGVVLSKEKAHVAMPSKVVNARIALINSPVEYKGKSFDAKISVAEPSQLNAFLQERISVLKETVARIKAIGANVIFAEKGIDDYCVSLMAKNNILAIRRVRRSDMEVLAKATGASIINNVDELDEESLGYAGLVEEKNIDGTMMVFVQECSDPKAASILIRGGTKHIVDEVERVVEDCLGTLPVVISTEQVLTGGGAAEVYLASKLRVFAEGVEGIQRLGIEAFARALEVIPKTLAENAGCNPLEVLVEMRSQNGRTRSEVGFDPFSGTVKDLYQENVIEPFMVKKQAIISASELALMILRINDIIAANKLSLPLPEGMPAAGRSE